jgi:hypothetical protein
VGRRKGDPCWGGLAGDLVGNPGCPCWRRLGWEYVRPATICAPIEQFMTNIVKKRSAQLTLFSRFLLQYWLPLLEKTMLRVCMTSCSLCTYWTIHD